jgi:MraZ protein
LSGFDRPIAAIGFMSEFVHSLDDKGRLTLPAKYRDVLAPGVVIARWFDDCLAIYPVATWAELARKLGELQVADEKARLFRRFILTGGVDDVPDSAGRILIPAYLREYAHLNGEVVIAGNGPYLEVWNPDLWQGQMRAFRDGTIDPQTWAAFGI